MHMDRARQHAPWRVQRFAVFGTEHIRQHQRIARTFTLFCIHAGDVEWRAGDLAQIGQSVVEFVVADRAGIVVQRIHRLVDRQFLIAGGWFDQGLVVGQCRALDRVAVVEQQAVGEFLARVADQGGGAHEAKILIVGQLVEVVAHDVGMQVRGFEHGDLGTRAVNGGCGFDDWCGSGAAGNCSSDDNEGNAAESRCDHGNRLGGERAIIAYPHDMRASKHSLQNFPTTAFAWSGFRRKQTASANLAGLFPLLSNR